VKAGLQSTYLKLPMKLNEMASLFKWDDTTVARQLECEAESKEKPERLRSIWLFAGRTGKISNLFVEDLRLLYRVIVSKDTSS
jgi:hypothetical protein